MMRFASLGSGSKGNATLLETGNTSILLDCGFSVKETERRLERLDHSAGDLNGILVTHEHSDHIRGVGALSRKYHLPVWLTAGTLRACSDPEFDQVHIIHAHECLEIGDMAIEPFPVPHDAREPCQYVFSDGHRRLGVLTDTGSLTPHIERTLSGVHGLLLECNYDTRMLDSGPYPVRLKRRVGGPYGHLSNDQASALLQRLDLDQLDCLIAMHVSENNNTHELAFAALDQGLEQHPKTLKVAFQKEGFDWQVL